MQRIVLATAMLMMTAGGAQAAATVIGGGFAKSCYNAAEYGTSNSYVDCDRALKEEMLGTEDRAATYVNRGILKMRAKRGEAALADAEASLRLIPDLPETLVTRGAAYILLRRYDEALADFDKAIASDVRRVHVVYYDRAIAREALGDVKGAYYDFKKSLEIEPGFALAEEELKRFTVTTVPKEPNGS